MLAYDIVYLCTKCD